MATQVKMPQLGLTMTEGVITRWLKSEGEFVVKGEPLFEVETDKLTNEVESEADGILRKIVAQEGAEVPVLGLVAVIGAADEEISLDKDVALLHLEKAESTDVTSAPVISTTAVQSGRVIASPLAKKIAVAKGMDLSTISGTGPNGRIVRRDVEGAQPKQTVAQPAVMPVPTHLSGTRRERMNGMRRSISKNMKLSWETAPVVHYNRSADVTALTELKNTLSQSGQKVSYTDILAKLVTNVLMEYPYVNSSIDGDDVIYHDYVNMGIAVALEDGLVVPVVKNLQSKGIGAISKEIRDLADRAKEGALTPDEMSGGTFTITNLGMFGMESFSPIINQPESAILGVNAIVKTPIEINEEIVMRPKINLSLTADHRVVDGAVAAQFIQKVCTLIENPWQMLL